MERLINQELYKNREKLPNTVKLLHPLLNDSFSKGDMLKEIERIEGKTLNIDFSYPIEFQYQANAMGIDTTFFVWDYTDSNFGKPLNLLERYFQAFSSAILN